MALRTFNVVNKADATPYAGSAEDFEVSAWLWNGVTFSPTRAPIVAPTRLLGTFAFAEPPRMLSASGLVLVKTQEEPSFWLFSVYLPNNSNQILEALFLDTATQALCPLASLPAALTAWSRLPAPTLYRVADGVVAARPSAEDIAALASGTLDAPAGYEPSSWTLSTEARIAPPSPEPRGGLGGSAFHRTAFVRRRFRTCG